MQASSVPTKFQVPFGASAGGSYIRSIPVAQPTPGNGQASLDTGFPSECFTPTGAGGYAPDGRDFNGILNMVSAWCQWLAAGGPVTYDATFQSEIGGYPQGAVVQSATTQGALWQSTVDNNTTDPDTGGAGWVLAGMPSGAVMPYAGTTAPAGWLLCYGQSLSTSAYPALFAAIGYQFGGSGSSFNAPDMRGRTPAGVDNMGGSPANRITSGNSGISGTTLGAAGGTELMQSHNHGVNDPGHTHNTSPYGLWTNQGGSAIGTSNAQSNSAILSIIPSNQTGITIQNAGSGGSQNVQPTMMLNYIIKT